MLTDPAILETLTAALAPRLDGDARRPFVLGLCGAQGSGKSTLAAELAARLNAGGVACAVLSLDDLYRTRHARQGLAREVHPLLATRGVPGTHDIALGLATIAALEQGVAAPLPRFDKAIDDRLPHEAWGIAPVETRILILEGWCVGARPQPADALEQPVNMLERDEDADGRWRRFVNEVLAGEYQTLFGRLDMLVLLAAPGFEVVEGWRTGQERALRARGGGGMPDAGIARFIQHYERLTRHILADMPAYADIVVWLDADRAVRAIDIQR